MTLSSIRPILAGHEPWWTSPLGDDRTRVDVRSPLLDRLQASHDSALFDHALAESGLERGAPGVWLPDPALAGVCDRILEDDVLWAAFRHICEAMRQDPAHDTMHVLRVATTTLQLARLQSEVIEDDTCILAALLHDVVNVEKGSPGSHLASGRSADAASKLLTGLGVHQTDIAIICNAIATHSYSSGRAPESPLGQCLQDADRLDALGAIGVLRAVHVGHRRGAALYDTHDPWAERRPPGQQRYVLDHVVVKLAKLHETLNTAQGRAIGRQRRDLLVSVFEDVVGPIRQPSTRSGT